MTPECSVCGHPGLRPDAHADWCERVAAWLRPQMRESMTPEERADFRVYMRNYRARKKAAAA